MKVTSLKPWPCRRFVEGGPAVLHTVRAKSSVFQKTTYSCSVISMFVIQLQPNDLFFMKFPRLTSRILATVDFQVWESSKVHFGAPKGHRKWKRKRKRKSERFWCPRRSPKGIRSRFGSAWCSVQSGLRFFNVVALSEKKANSKLPK